MDLVTFLRARLDELEAAAKAASERVGPEWRLDEYDPPDPFSDGIVGSTGHQVVNSGDVLVAQGIHIALNDPALVLADVAAKREILDVCENYIGDGATSGADLGRQVVRLLGESFASHPDFDPAWTAP